MTEADWDAMLDALSDEHRRRLLVNLLDHNPQEDTVSVPEAIQTTDADLDVLQPEFVHKHLPKHERLGYVRWDRDAHEVVKGPKFDEIGPLLELIENHREELPAGWP